MESSVWLLTTLWLLVTVTGQDTTLKRRNNDVSYKGRWSFYHAAAANITRLEQRLDRRTSETERRVQRRVYQQLQLQAQKHTQEMTSLQTLVEHLDEKLTDVSKKDKDRKREVESLRRQLRHHSRDIRQMAVMMDILHHDVINLTETVNILRDVAAQTTSAPTPAETGPVEFSPLFPVDCQEVYAHGGMKYPGYYFILIQPYLADKPFKASCKMTNHSGWTVIQRRQDGREDFYRTWSEYKDGFGDPQTEFWLGNQHIHKLTNQGNYRLRIEMKDMDESTYWAEYDHFRIADEDDQFRLHVHGYHGNAGDSLTPHLENHDNQMFSTKDRDNDLRYYDNCAEHYHSAWWFKSCFASNLNGNYYQRGNHNNYFVRDGIQWNSIHTHSSLQFVEMMIKPNPEGTEFERDAADVELSNDLQT